MLHDIVYDTPTDSEQNAPVSDEQAVRQQAIRQIERKRRFRIRAVVSAIGMLALVAIWAISEYHTAGGWPAAPGAYP